MSLRTFLPKDGKILEIGPLDNPYLTRPEYDVYYADINTTEKVKEYYKDTYADFEKIVNIDFPIGDGSYIDAVGDMRFDAAYSANCIEHTHDVIRHLREISDILIEGGRYVISIPNKRYIFDYFREATPFRDAYDIFCGGSINRLLLDSRLNSSPHRGDGEWKLFWQNRVSFLIEAVDDVATKESSDLFHSTVSFNDYVDRHIWVFTHISFLELIRDCLRFNLLPYSLEYHKGLTKIEIILKKDSDLLINDLKRTAEIIKIQCNIEQVNNIPNFISFIDNNYKSRKVYIYGIGKIAWIAFTALKASNNDDKISGFIVSENQRKEESFSSKQIFNLSEFTDETDRSAIVVAADKEQKADIKQILKQHGFGRDDIFFI